MPVHFPKTPIGRACHRAITLTFTGATLAWCCFAWSKPVPVSEPIAGHIILRPQGKSPGSSLDGVLTAADSDSLIFKSTAGEEKQYLWTDLTGPTAYKLRYHLIDKKKASDWLELGTFAWGVNDTAEGRAALSMASQLDHSLKDDVEAVEASTAGILYDPPPDTSGDLLHDVPAGSAGKNQFDPAQLSKDKYSKVWPSEAKKALAETRDDCKKISEDMKVKLKEVETDHFLIFTDWGPQGDAFLKKNMEDAYKIVTKQFEIPATENIFVGKLGVYMFNNYADFAKFSQTYDGLPKTLPSGGILMGYFRPRGDVMEHMAMSKPNREKLGLDTDAEAAKVWGYTLTHEFTHAFVARYRSGRRIPMWLNEGIAEVIASTQFPRDVRQVAASKSGTNFKELFKDNASIQAADLYPVMRTLTETLIKRDGKRFIRMFDDIKAGANGEQALREAYNWSFDDLVVAWRKYLGIK